MNRILILFAHPALEKSRVQYRLLKAVEDLDNVIVHDLYELYADFMIDVKSEQRLLLRSDIIIFQHPFYWYSAPAIIKEWQDLVLERGFAYGPGGTALQGKYLGNMISAGGSWESYNAEGHNRYSFQEFFRPFEQTARICQMHYLPPFVVHSTHAMSEASIDDKAEAYRALIRRLRKQTPDHDLRKELLALNDWNGVS
ncbi:MAG: glutathione-regulated potassium-efflux system oxidoreductase KefF [Thiotrichales bacterium]